MKWAASLGVSAGTFIALCFSLTASATPRTTLLCGLQSTGPSGSQTLTKVLDTSVKIEGDDFSTLITRIKSLGVLTIAISKKDPFSETFKKVAESSVRVQQGTRGDNSRVTYAADANMFATVSCTLN